MSCVDVLRESGSDATDHGISSRPETLQETKRKSCKHFEGTEEAIFLSSKL